MAAARGSGRRGEGRERQREATGGGGGWERRVGASAKQEVAGWPSTAGGGTTQRRRAVLKNRAGRLEGGEKGPKCNFQNFQGPNCKQEISFKLKLK